MKKRLSVLIAFLGVLLGCNSDLNTIPNFEFTTLDGQNISSKDLKGKANVLVVWATWCGDCIREIPELNELAEKYHDNPKVNLIAFSDEDEAKVTKSLERFPFNFTHVVNATDYTDQLKSGITKHFPQVLVVDDKLNVVFNVTENRKPIFNDLDQQIQTILAK